MSSSARGLSACCLLLALPVAAFVAGRPERLPPADFTFVLPQENATFDPAAATSFADGMVIQALFEGLTRLDPVTVEPRPGVAERFETGADGVTVTFRLRADARWSDGQPVTAQDFLFAWRRAIDPATASVNAALFSIVAGAEAAAQGRLPLDQVGLAAPDDRTFVVRLREPCPYLPALAAHFAFMPVREDRIARHGADWTRPGLLVGNGPYRLALRRLRDRIRLERNEYWHGAASVQAAVIDGLAVDATATALNLFLTGEADWLNVIPPTAVPALAGREELRLATVLGTNFLRFNTTVPPLDDPRVRRALDLAIDRAALCRYVYRAGEAPAHTLVPPALGGYAPPAAANPLADALARANTQLGQAGFPGGEGFPELELLYPAQEAARAVAEALAAQVGDRLGVRLRPVPQEAKVFIDSQRTLRYQVCLANWVGDYADPTTFLDLFRAGAPNNRTGWRDAEYDALLDRAAAERDPARRMALLAEAEALLLERGPIAPIAYRAQANLVSPRVDGFTSNVLDWHPLERIRIRVAQR